MHDDEGPTIHVEGTYGGLPYKGPPIDIKEDDPEHRKPQLVRKVHVRKFDMGDADQLEEYTAVCQRVIEGSAVQSYELKEFVPERSTWVILLRWFEHYYTAPGAEKSGA